MSCSLRGLDEALEMMAERPEARPIAGGTDLMVELNRGEKRPQAIVDVSHLTQLDVRHRNGDTFLGAGLTYSQILRDLHEDRALAQAARAVGSPQIRNRGTLGGNLGTASPAGDLLPVLAVRDASIELIARGGRRSVPWSSFLTGPKRNTMEPGELILGARWRTPRGPSVFAKVGPRNAMVISICNVCLQLDEDGRAVRVAMGSVGPTVLRASAAETFAAGALGEAGGWDDPSAAVTDSVVDRFAELVEAAAEPTDDVRGTAAYRRHAVRVLARRTFVGCSTIAA